MQNEPLLMNMTTIWLIASIVLYASLLTCAIYVVFTVLKDILTKFNQTDVYRKVYTYKALPVADAEHLLAKNIGWEYVKYTINDQMQIRKEIDL